ILPSNAGIESADAPSIKGEFFNKIGWDRSSGRSRRSLQGQDSFAAPPQVRFEPRPKKMQQRRECLLLRNW
ncbi:hypothetical protein, partial [Primorskyibacter sp. 2E233]|uniref:hypothetical protein n=1 Tax=Primorskyibacter sp. 2E233 TaxID=3413431 RepID=UPI003BEFAE4A